MWLGAIPEWVGGLGKSKKKLRSNVVAKAHRNKDGGHTMTTLKEDEEVIRSALICPTAENLEHAKVALGAVLKVNEEMREALQMIVCLLQSDLETHFGKKIGTVIRKSLAKYGE